MTPTETKALGASVICVRGILGTQCLGTTAPERLAALQEGPARGESFQTGSVGESLKSTFLIE